ncbi:MAG: cytochrome b/b6 domain-containing protein [Rhodoferax sp.]
MEPVVVRVWDLPTRVFHWSLVGCVSGLVITGNIGGNAMQWHFWLGYTVLALLLFRLVWGFVGGYWSRFSTFLFSPRSIVSYVKGLPEPLWTVGHNPLGSLSVFGILGVLLAQVSTGMMSDDTIAWQGPLVRWVNEQWVEWATYYHKDIGKVLLIGLVLLHLNAIAFYRFVKGQRLVAAMITGDKHLNHHAPDASDSIRQRVKASIILALCLSLVWFGVLQWG